MTTALRLEPEPETGRGVNAISAADVRAIVDQAETLDHRLTQFDVDDTTLSDEDGEAIARWTQCVTRGDARAFARRLAWDGLTSAHASAAIATPTGDSPDWMPTLRTVCDVMANGQHQDAAPADETAPGGADDVTPVAFEALLAPFLLVGRQRVRMRAASQGACFEPVVHAVLERALMEQLSRICRRALYVEFSGFQRAQAFIGEAYNAFMQHMLRGGMLAFFQQYPMAARLSASATDLWVEATLEFLTRLDGDRDAIADTFGDGSHQGAVTRLHANLSDPHCGGRSVLIAEFASGLSVVYKPRPLGVDAAFGRLLHWANDHLDGIALRPLRVLTCGDYGWIERASHGPCSDDAGVERYYTRCGALLCLVYALNGGDFHHENLLAAGEHPMLLDLEMLLGHRFLLAERLPAAGMPDSAAKRRHVESVLNLRMLPVPKPVVFGVTCESGALSDEQTAQHRALRDGLPVPAARHIPAIIHGFTALYQALRDGATELLAPGGVLEAFRGESVRFILRNTSLYLTLIERGLRPEHLKSGITFGMELDVLAKTFLSMDERPPIWPAVAAEKRALEHLDVPLFTARIDSRDLRLPTGVVVPNCFEESAFEMMSRRLRGLSDEDLADQVDLIVGAFAAASGRGLRVKRRTPPTPSAPSPLAPDAREITRDEAIHAARTIARDIGMRVAMPGSATISWIGAGYLPAARCYEVRPMSYDRFDGYGGMAVFFAALYVTTRDEEFRMLAQATLAPVRIRLDEIERVMQMRRTSDVGMGYGPASIAYALAETAHMLDDPALLDDARRLANLVTPLLVASEDTHDIVAGSAGAVISLLALSDTLHDPALLTRADAFGAHLLRRRSIDGVTGLTVWRAPSGVAEIGFAHGQAGIAYALACLARATANPSYAAAARDAIAFERACLHKEPSTALIDEHAAAWGHGTTGIALARFGDSAMHGDADTRTEIDAAIERACASFGTGVDSFCCGDAARLDLLREASHHYGRPELIATARREAAALIKRAAARGGYDTGWPIARRWEPGLFHGTAGIGYTMLRLVEPSLPSLCLIA
ncbi:MAG: type 2 lanthipeptide synthetase LanM family protein [bacterium]